MLYNICCQLKALTCNACIVLQIPGKLLTCLEWVLFFQFRSDSSIPEGCGWLEDKWLYVSFYDAKFFSQFGILVDKSAWSSFLRGILKFLGELVRVAAPGGRIILVTWCHRDLQPGETSLKPDEKVCLPHANSLLFFQLKFLPNSSRLHWWMAILVAQWVSDLSRASGRTMWKSSKKKSEIIDLRD